VNGCRTGWIARRRACASAARPSNTRSAPSRPGFGATHLKTRILKRVMAILGAQPLMEAMRA